MSTSHRSAEDPVVLFLGNPAEGRKFECIGLACRFHGFVLQSTAASRWAAGDSSASTQAGSPILAVVPASDFSQLPVAQWRELLARLDRERIPLAVVGITPDSDRSVFHLLCDDVQVQVRATPPDCGLWAAAREPGHTGFELRGVRLKLGPRRGHALQCPAGISSRVLATIGVSETESHPLLIALRDGGRYLLAGTVEPTLGGRGEPELVPFGELAPYFLMLRDVGGARCWRAPAALANLTIDDPSLREPYGRLSYPGLIAEMQRARFHATIGFIPWNYDRSDPAVVEMFRAHPEHLSLAVHGNNHEGYEFFRYEAKPGDTQRSAPFAKQVFNIRQALARIGRFEKTTGLAVDRVMVFPQAISPAPTLETLRHEGFWATSNFSNVPLDATVPDDPTAALRSALTDWHDLPALRRDYPHEYSEEAVAIDLFLGNPVLFMAHQDDFAEGIDAFNRNAERVNRRQPAVRWASLGEVSRHLHRLRWLTSDTCSVRMVSRHARLTNTAAGTSRFEIAWPRTDVPEGTKVTIDGTEHASEFRDGAIRFAISLPPGGSALVELMEPPAPPTPVPLQRSGLRKRYLRFIADFRDLVVSRSAVGRALTQKYYRKLRRPALKTGRGRRRIALLWDGRPGESHLKTALLTDLPPELR